MPREPLRCRCTLLLIYSRDPPALTRRRADSNKDRIREMHGLIGLLVVLYETRSPAAEHALRAFCNLLSKGQGPYFSFPPSLSQNVFLSLHVFAVY